MGSLGNKPVRLPTPAALRAHYDAIFTPAFVARIRADVPQPMFVRDEGTMLGGGAVWFDDDGAVVTLNN